MFAEFKKDLYFLAKFHLKSSLIFFVLNCFMWWVLPPDMRTLLWYLPAILLLNSTQVKAVMAACAYAIAVTIFKENFKPIYMVSLTCAVVATLSATAFLHNASHRSFKPKWLNRPVGELMCLFQLTGFPDWTVIHVFHHTYSDDPELDPHPPGNKTYWQYVSSVRKTILSVFIKHYFKIFGNTPESVNAIKIFGRMMKLDHFMKIFFWYLLLRPQLFTFFFIPSVVLKMFNHAWVNWANHKWTGDGTELVNFDGGLYRIGNFFSFGIYYHKNHHINPSLFDPRKLKGDSATSNKRSVA